MAKSKRRHATKAAKAAKTPKVEGRGFVAVRSPFSGIDPALLRERLMVAAKQHATETPGRLNRFLELFRKVSPPDVIATLSAFGLQVGVAEDGSSSRNLSQTIQQHHLEILQALMLTLPISEWGAASPPPLDIQVAIDDIQALTMGFQHQRFVALEEAEDPQQRMVITLSEKIRMHTQMVRNWGYFSDVGAISRELYGALDEPLEAHHGFSASDLITVAQHLVALLEARMNVRWTGLRKTMRGRTPQRIIRGFYAQFPDAPGNAEALIDMMPRDVSREKAGSLVLTLYSQSLFPMMTLTSAEVAAAGDLDEAIVTRVMDALSLSPGALEGQAPERFFMDNPIWAAPLVRWGEGYFCALPQAIFSKIHDIMRRLANEASLQTALASRRATYLETKVETLLRTALPGAQVRNGVTWQMGSARYETDLVARLDRTLIIVEAKSAALTPQGLRGAPDRVRRHIRELVVAPSEQSARLETLVRRAAGGDAQALSGLSEFGDLIVGLDEVVRISVTLDDISILSSSEHELKEAGWAPEDLELGCTLNLADFGCVLEILGTPARVVHYFAERQRIQKAVEMLADEMDYLGFYLRSAFNIAGFEGADRRLILTGMSKDIDTHYTCRDAGIAGRTPQILVQPYFAKLFQVLEQRRPDGWLSITCDVMRAFDLVEQKQAETWMNRLKRTVERSWRDPDHECSILVTPPPIREAAILIHVYPPQLADVRRDRVAYLAQRAMDESGRERCVVISRDTSRWNEPYSFAGVAILDKASAAEQGSGGESLMTP